MTGHDVHAVLEQVLNGEPLAGVERAEDGLVRAEIEVGYLGNGVLRCSAGFEVVPPGLEIDSWALSVGFSRNYGGRVLQARASGDAGGAQTARGEASLQSMLSKGRQTAVYAVVANVKVAPGHYKMWTKYGTFDFEVTDLLVGEEA